MYFTTAAIELNWSLHPPTPFQHPSNMSINSAYEELRIGKVLTSIYENITSTVPDALKCVILNRSTSITAGVDGNELQTIEDLSSP